MSSDSGLVLLDGRVRCRSAERLGDVSLSATKDSGAALLLVVDHEVVSADPIVHYIFHSAMKERGHLLLVDPHDDDELVSALPSGAEAARLWVNQGLTVEVVAVRPVPLSWVTMAVLVSTGIAAPKAVDAVYNAMNEAPSAHDEVACAVYLEKVLAYRAWHEARRFQLREGLQ